MRTFCRLAIIAALVAFATALGPAEPVAAATPTPTNPQPIRLTAGVQVGYRIDAAGNLATVRTITLARPSMGRANARRAVTGHGTYLRLTTGSLAGLWVRESTLAFVPGTVGLAVLSPARAVKLPVDAATGKRTYIGYQLTSGGALTGTKVRTLTAAATVLADRSAVIDGRRYVRVANGIWAGWWMPASSWTGLGVTCQAGHSTTAGSMRTLTRVTTAGAEVALTFDMGGRLTPAKAILTYLLLERVCTTVFPTGAAVATTEGAAAMAIVAAHPELFEVGNHTQHHCNLRDGGGGAACPSTRPTAAFVTSELKGAATRIQAATGLSPAPYWRPPYGAVDATLRAQAAAAGYTRTVMWAVDTIDWRPLADGGPTALDIARKLRAMPAGGIALMHLGGYNTLDGLPYAIAGLRSLGLKPTSVSDLLK